MFFRGYEAVIGLEVHAQLKTHSKIFSSDQNKFEALDNENTSPVSVGMPGTLPVLNHRAVEYAIKTGLALGCQIRKKSIFARKNYFYPDLPKGYQISQYEAPLCELGSVSFLVEGKEKTVQITRAHLEEDAGKSMHHGDYTLINYNRAGIPLLEIVSAPEIKTPKEAAEYAKMIRQILRYLDVCDGNLEEGSMRCDCNVSVMPVGSKTFGTKVELKNINSFRFVEKAIEFEIDRQIDLLESQQRIIQETRLWDPDKNRTVSMRTKEDAQDYRYFPDPDLLPLEIKESWINDIKKTLPELPYAKMKRFTGQLGLPEYDAQILSFEKDMADFFEEVVKHSHNSKAAANWLMTDLTRELNSQGISIKHSPILPVNLGKMIKLIDQGSITGKIAKTVFQEMWKTQEAPEAVLQRLGLVQISDKNALESMVEKILGDNPSQVKDYQSGKTKLLGFFVGAVMKASKGQANPDLVNKILTEKLKKI